MITFLQIHPADNLLVALQKLPKGTQIKFKVHEMNLQMMCRLNINSLSSPYSEVIKHTCMAY